MRHLTHYPFIRQRAAYSPTKRAHKRADASARPFSSKEVPSGDVECGHHAYPLCNLPSIRPTTLLTSDLYRSYLSSPLPISRASVYGSAVPTWRRGRRTQGRGFRRIFPPTVFHYPPLGYFLKAGYRAGRPIVDTAKEIVTREHQLLPRS